MRRSTWIAALIASGAWAGCSGDDGGGGTSPTSDGPGTSTDSSASASASASASTTTSSTDTTTATSTSTTGEDTSTSAVDTGTSDGTTGGRGACEVEVPAPGECQMGAGVGPRFWGLDDVIGGGEDLVPAGGRSGAVAADDPDPFGGPNFIVVDGGTAFECDIFEQDCPAGQKCMPWANDGGTSWNATRCSPLDPNPNSVGDPCTVEGSGVSGIDDCDGTSMCFGADPETNMGTCVAFCTCSADNPICEQEGTFCTIANQGVLALCREPCNPLDPQACPADELCVASGGMFVCTPDASGRAGAAGDPCQFLNVCDPGHFCASASVVPDCAGSQACCSAYCEIGDNSNCLQGQDCIPWYGQGEAPDACLAEVGACAIP